MPPALRRFYRPLWLICAVGVTLVTAGAIGLYTWYYFDEAVGPRVLCLLYHRFVTPEEFARCKGDDRYYAIPVETFERQLAYLSSHGFHTLSTRECLDFVKGRRQVPENSVYITIDDGYTSALTRAQPLLKKFAMRATLFATADPHADVFHRGNPPQNRMTDSELRRLDPGVIEVQAHGLTHRPLTHLKDTELLTELTLARDRLEHVLGHPVRCMAVPGNDYDARVMSFAKAAGYEAVFTSDPGSLDAGDSLIGLPRVNVAGYFDTKAFATLLDPASMARRRFIRAIAVVPRQILGSRVGGALSSWVTRGFAREPSWSNYLTSGLVLTALVWCIPSVWSRRSLLTLRWINRREIS